MVGTGYRAYRRTDVVTADPKKLVILCYEGVIDSLKRAQAGYRVQDYEDKAQALQKALEIIAELRGALNFEKGGEIARNLEALYVFWSRMILEADRSRNLRSLDQVVEMLSEIKSALDQAYSARRGPLPPMDGPAGRNPSPFLPSPEMKNHELV